MLQHFVRYCFKFLAALNFYRGPRPFALALGFGCFLGLMYGENGLLVLLSFVLACILPMNHVLMLISSIFSSILGALFLAWQLRLGAFLLENSVLFYVFQFVDNIPLLSWLGLNETSNLGALISGAFFGSLIFIISYSVLLLIPKPKAAQRRFREKHRPKFLLHSKKFAEWKNEYEMAFQSLELAQRIQEETRKRELNRPDSY